MAKFSRTHNTGTEVIVNQGIHGWRIHINLREPAHTPMTITGFLAPTLESAKKLGDEEVFKFGHVCVRSCKDWVQVPGHSSSGHLFDPYPRVRDQFP